MNTIVINAGNSNYLSEFLEDLPDNGFLEKVVTGCGCTSVALTNNKNYVITVPYVSIIKNKLASNPNVLGVYEDIDDEEILEYLSSSINPKKILVTYDSLRRITKLLNPQDYKILVDEAHKLIDSGSFRTEAVETVLENYEKYNSYCFATATPVKDKYQLPQLVEIQKYQVKWNNIKPVNIEYCKFEDDLNQRIAVLIIKYLKEELPGNPYFFINSVTSIIQIISSLKKAGYNNPELYKIICGNNKNNEAKIKHHLGSDYTIGFTTDPIKKVTFCTATLFEGSDLFDKEGVTYVITDGRKDNTKYDVLTTLPQIIGRLRDTKYKNPVYVLLSPSYYFSYTTVEEFEHHVKGQLKEAEEFISLYESTPTSMIREALKRDIECNAYVLERNDTLKVNTSALYAEMHNYEALHTQYYYRDSVTEGSFATINIHTIPHIFTKANLELNVEGLNKLRLNKKANFKDLCIDYLKCKEENIPTQIKDIELVFPIIKEAYDLLGADKMKALKYQKTDFKQELLIRGQINNNSKIIRLLDLNVGELVEKNKIKLRIQQIYNDLSIPKKAKATDLSQWYSITECGRIVNSKKEKRFKIISIDVK